MSNLVVLSASALAAATASYLAVGAWSVPVVVGIYLGVVAWGVTSLRSGLLCEAVWRGSDGVLLTFDDGPDPRSTPALLDLLRVHQVRAIFFLIGHRVAAHPELARRIVDEGHTAGNHSYRHSRWHNFFFAGRMTRDLSACQAAIEKATGVVPRLCRPPFGLANHATASVTRTLGLRVVGWRLRSNDGQPLGIDRVVRRVRRKLRRGDIVLLHDGGRSPERVVAITTAVIEAARRRGLRIASPARALDG